MLEILKFPDPRLRIKCQSVEKVTEEHVKLAKDMLETMYSSRGIGLAAAQVNHQIRLIVIDTRPKEVSDGRERYDLSQLTDLEKLIVQPLVLFNPEITGKNGKNTYEEGCLSVPTFFETVERFNYIEVRALDINGHELFLKTDGLLSICIQHEIDHLDGKLFIDRLSTIKGNRIKNKIKKFGYPEASESDEDVEDVRAAEHKL